MTTPDRDDSFLDGYFAAARDGAPEPSPDLLARVLADAGAEQARQAAGTRDAAHRPGLWATMLAALGGWPALGGLATAGVAGLWLGISPPVALDDSLATLRAMAGVEDTATGLWGESTDALTLFGLDALGEG